MSTPSRPIPRKPVRAALALLISLVLALSACGGGSGSGGSGPDSFRVGVLSNFLLHLTPGQSGNSFIDYALFTPLTSVDAESQEVQMEVAESVESDDQVNWTITLADDWTFSDGTPVTAQSFADSWNATALGSNGWLGNLQFAIIDGYDALNPAEGEPKTTELEGVEVVDDTTLKVTLTKPTSMFPFIISGTTWAPMPESAFDDLETYDQRPVGNGPFKIDGDGIGPGVQQLSLVRNDDYAGEQAASKQVDVKIYQDPNSQYTSFQGGEIDLALVDGTNLADASTRYGDDLVTLNFPAVVFLGFPLWDKRFEDVDVRTAMARAIDRETIAGSLLRDAVDPATTLAPPTLLGSEGLECDTCTFDPDQAGELIGDWSGDLTLWTNDDPTQAEVIKAIANGFRDTLGIDDVKTQTQPVDQIYTNLAEKKIDGPFLLYTGVTYPHLYAVTSNLFTPSLFNVTGYSSDEVDRALAAAAAADSPEAAVPSTQEAAEIGLTDVSITPVYFPKGGIVHAPTLEGVTPEILGGPHLAGISAS